MENLEGIAVIGMAGRFPGAQNLHEYWHNIANGIETIHHFSNEELLEAGVSHKQLEDADYVKANALLKGVEYFDADFFGFNPREAEILDPQQRIFLETAKTALDDAACDPETYQGLIGIYAGGGGFNNYLISNLISNKAIWDVFGSYQMFLANERDFLSTRTSYKLNLKGPGVTVQTACSTSLVAVHMACQSLLGYQSDVALAGGVRVTLPQYQGYKFQEGSILSKDGHCRPFDANAGGTVAGDGVGIVVLKRLEDALEDGDNIYAVIRGSAYNNDGIVKAGFTAPSVEGQAEAIAMAHAVSAIDVDTIEYLEAHGTGTVVGDPIEVSALTQAFRMSTAKKGYCALGSVKANIGHTDTAAGIAGFIKAVLALKHQSIPPLIHFKNPNPTIDFENSPFYINTDLKPWKTSGHPRRAGVSAFGLGGTNAHVVLEEYNREISPQPSRPYQLIAISAKNRAAVDDYTRDLGEWLKKYSDSPLPDVAYTLMTGRTHYNYRRILVASDNQDAAEALISKDPERILTANSDQEHRPVTFMFAGGGAQYPNMGADLYQLEPVYRKIVDQCLEILKSRMDLDVRGVLFPHSDQTEYAKTEIQKPSVALPTLFTTSYALSKLLISWGVEPKGMIGHSMGEYVAACLAETFSLEDALFLVTSRGRLFEQLPEGGMLSVSLKPEELKPLMGDELSFAAINGPELCVASGPVQAIEQLQRTLESKEIDCRKIKISVAAHSWMLKDILVEFREVFSQVELHHPKVPFISNLSGTWIKPEEATDPDYWVKHLRETVEFSNGLKEVLAHDQMMLLEVGPGRTLSTLASQHPNRSRSQPAFSSMRHPKEEMHDIEFLLTLVGKLWLAGVALDWNKFYENETRNSLPLPGYAFQRKKYWIEAGDASAKSEPTALSEGKRPDISSWFYIPTWKRTIPAPQFSHGEVSYVLIGEATCMASFKSNATIKVHTGEGYSFDNNGHITIDIEKPEHYHKLIESLDTSKSYKFIHLLGLRDDKVDDLKYQKNGHFYSLLYLAQALAQRDWKQGIELCVVTRGAQMVESGDKVNPAKSLALGPLKVIPLELPYIKTQMLDLEPKYEHPIPARVMAELQSAISDQIVAYRGSMRYVKGYEKAPIHNALEGSELIKSDGTYLITGGLGGVGLSIAKRIAQEKSCNLILLGRTDLPAGDQWQSIVQEGTHPKREVIEELIKVEQSGSRVDVQAADVSDRQQMEQVVNSAVKKYGKIDGLIHAAGTLNDGVIALKTKEGVERVFATKVDGTRIIKEILKDQQMDFFVACSALSTATGSLSQVDYVAANAFLNGFADQLNGSVKYLSIQWGTWKEVGMAARLMEQPQMVESNNHIPESAEELEYPWWDRHWKQGVTDHFVANYSLGKHWLLDEHRVKDGPAIIPGSGFVELIKVAAMIAAPAFDIKEIIFEAPFAVTEGEEKDLFLEITEASPIRKFVFYSYDLQGNRMDHVSGELQKSENHTPTKFDLVALEKLCPERNELSEAQGEHMQFGKRWDSVQEITYGNGACLCKLELPKEFHSDLQKHILHPALLDLATAGAKPLIEGYDPTEDFHVAMSYGEVKFYRGLESSVLSFIKYKPEHSSKDGQAVYDVSLMDSLGNELVNITDFVIRNVGKGAMQSITPSSTGTQENLGNVVLEEALREGMTPEEGAEAFMRALGVEGTRQILVSPLELQGLQNKVLSSIYQESEEEVEHAEGHERPELTTEFVAPRNETEKVIAGVWESALGIRGIGVYDDFFELGGHSLMFTQIISRIRKKIEINISIKDLFDKPTISGIAEKSGNESGKRSDKKPKIVRVSRETYRE